MKFRVAKVLYGYPRTYAFLRPVWLRVRWLSLRTQMMINRSRVKPDTATPISVRPDQFFLSSAGSWPFREPVGQLEIELEAFVEELKRGSSDDWAGKSFQTPAQRIESGESVFGLRSVADLKKSIEEHLSTSQSPDPPSAVASAEIDKHGRVCLLAGHVSVALARKKGDTKVLASVQRRAAEWQSLRNEIAAEVVQRGGNLYQKVLHPDLDEFPAMQTCEDRLAIIEKHLPAGLKTLTDIGSEFGQFPRFFEDHGFEVTGIEEDPKCVYYLTKIRDIMQYRFRIFPHDVRTYVPDKPVDVLVALSVLHFFTKTSQGIADLEALLGRLAPKMIFFQPPRSDEYNNRGWYRIFEPDEFAGLITRWARLSQWERIGVCNLGRPVYRIF